MTPEQIKELRKKAGLTQLECSNIMGYKTVSAWQRFEVSADKSSHVKPPARTLKLFTIEMDKIIKNKSKKQGI